MQNQSINHLHAPYAATKLCQYHKATQHETAAISLPDNNEFTATNVVATSLTHNAASCFMI